MNGDPETGVTIMRVVKALDAGAMLAMATVPIAPDARTDMVERRLADVGGALLVETVDRLTAGPVDEVPQRDAEATYAPRLRKEEGLVDWSRPARAIHDQIRGLQPWPHAFTFAPMGRLILHRSSVATGPAHDAAPGTVVAASQSEGLSVATGDGMLDLLELQAEGGKVLPARVFLAGHPLKPGDRLGAA
jgi:methionyl-tRNA formyltransferase